MDMADVDCHNDDSSYNLFHSSAKEMIDIHHKMFIVLNEKNNYSYTLTAE